MRAKPDRAISGSQLWPRAPVLMPVPVPVPVLMLVPVLVLVLVLVLVPVLVLGCAHRALAQPTDPSATGAQPTESMQAARERCAVFWTLGDDLPSEEASRNLFQYCIDGSLNAGATLNGIAADVTRLAWRGHWPMAQVGEALGPARLQALLQSEGRKVGDGWTKDDAKALQALLQRPCAKTLLNRLAQAEDGPSWLEREALVKECGTKPSKNEAPTLPVLDTLLSGRVLWTIFTQAPLDRMSFDLIGRTALHFAPQPLDSAVGDDAPRSFSMDVAGFTAHVALVPEGSLVTTTASAPSSNPQPGLGPMHRVELAGSDFGFLLKLPSLDAMACLDVRVDLNANEQYAVLVDGHRLPCGEHKPGDTGTTTVFSRYCVEPERPHRFHVVALGARDAAGAAAPIVLVDQKLDAERLKPGADHIPIHFDLTRSKQITLLLDVGALCESAGLDREIVRQQLTAFMQERFGEERFVDPEQLAAMVGAARALSSDGAQARGSDVSRGGLDFVGLIDSLSTRQLRRGFESILDARLVCSKRAENLAWDYSFAVTAHRPGSEPNKIGPYALTTSDPTELADIIREPIARMGQQLEEAAEHGGSYARLVGAPSRAVSFRETRLLATASPAASSAIRLETTKLSGESASVVCDGVSAYRQLRSATFSSSAAQHELIGKAAFEQAEALEDEPGSFLLPNGGPGSYLLRLRTGNVSGRGVDDSAYRCVKVYEPDPLFWGAVLGGYEVATFSPTLRRSETSLRTSFLFGYRQPRSTWRFGFGLGYSLSWRALPALPSLDDLPGLPNETAKRFGDRGELELKWRRHSVLLYPTLDVRIPVLGGRYRPFARGLLMLDGGVLTGDIAAGLEHFDASSGVDFDVDAQLFLGSEIQLDERYTLTLMFGIGLYAFDDALLVTPRRQSYDAMLDLSLGVGMML